MKAQNIVAFHAPQLPRCWRQDELQRLVSLYSARDARGGAVSWSVGQTEAGDPQFYIVGAAPELDCMMCVTRIGRLYVLEDGAGSVVAEDACLERILEAAAKQLYGRRSLSFVARSLVGLCAFRAILDQKIELMLAESMEHLSRFAPQLVALV